MWKAAIGAGLMAAGLGACDAIDPIGDNDPLEEYQERAELNQELAERVTALPVATAAEMPDQGSATYEGYAGIVLGSEGDTALIGDAAVTADFTEGTVEGTLNDFVGTVEGGEVQEFAGDIDLDDGLIGVGSASGIVADMDGRLTGDETGDEVTVSGGLTGDFRSDGVRGATALTATADPTTDFLVNDREVGGLMSVVAE